LAMMCDIIYAGTTAKFSQPEIKLGTIPGGGGTQRLPRAIGKSKAMEMILTGRHFSAVEAEKLGKSPIISRCRPIVGLVSKVVPAENLIEEAVNLAKEIGQFPLSAVILCKKAINNAYEMSLSSGLDYERDLFHATFSLVSLKT